MQCSISARRKIPGHYCNKNIKSYTSKAAAESACSHQSNCLAISDARCDNKGTWTTCGSGTGTPFKTGCLP